jgi:hypothetical protein
MDLERDTLESTPRFSTGMDPPDADGVTPTIGLLLVGERAKRHLLGSVTRQRILPSVYHETDLVESTRILPSVCY